MSFCSDSAFAISKKRTKLLLKKKMNLSLRLIENITGERRTLKKKSRPHLSPRYSYVTMVCGYPFWTILNWHRYPGLRLTDWIFLGPQSESVTYHIPLTYGRTYVLTIFWQRKFLGCIGKQILLPMVLRYNYSLLWSDF